MKAKDLHRQRTDMKFEILSALERLLQNAPYVDIEIHDICDEAYISKPTFYRYFQNKDNIVRWMSKQAIKCGVVEIGRKYTWLEGYYLTSLVQYKHKIFYCDPQSPAFISALIDFSANYQQDSLIETITEFKGVELSEKLSYQIESLTIAQGYMARRWAEEGMRQTPEVMADYLTSIVPHDLFKLLNEPTKKQETSSDQAPR